MIFCLNCLDIWVWPGENHFWSSHPLGLCSNFIHHACLESKTNYSGLFQRYFIWMLIFQGYVEPFLRLSFLICSIQYLSICLPIYHLFNYVQLYFSVCNCQMRKPDSYTKPSMGDKRTGCLTDFIVDFLHTLIHLCFFLGSFENW